MRVSSKPRRTTAKATSWPLISGSLVGNRSSWFGSLTRLLACALLGSVALVQHDGTAPLVLEFKNVSNLQNLRRANEIKIPILRVDKELVVARIQEVRYLLSHTGHWREIYMDFPGCCQHGSRRVLQALFPFSNWPNRIAEPVHRCLCFTGQIESGGASSVCEIGSNRQNTVLFNRVDSNVLNRQISTLADRHCFELPLHNIGLLVHRTELGVHSLRSLLHFSHLFACVTCLLFNAAQRHHRNNGVDESGQKTQTTKDRDPDRSRDYDPILGELFLLRRLFFGVAFLLLALACSFSFVVDLGRALLDGSISRLGVSVLYAGLTAAVTWLSLRLVLPDLWSK